MMDTRSRFSAIACQDCFIDQHQTGRIYCPHHRLLQAWIGGTRVVIVNAESREDADQVLRSVIDRMRGNISITLTHPEGTMHDHIRN